MQAAHQCNNGVQERRGMGVRDAAGHDVSAMDRCPDVLPATGSCSETNQPSQHCFVFRLQGYDMLIAHFNLLWLSC